MKKKYWIEDDLQVTQSKNSGAYSRVATLIQPSFQKKKKNPRKKKNHFSSDYSKVLHPP